MSALPAARSGGDGGASHPFDSHSAADLQAAWPAPPDNPNQPEGDAVRQAVQTALHSLLTHVRQGKNTVHEEARNAVEQLIEELDRKISVQLSRVLHHPSFQQLEGTWRGLHFLVDSANGCASLNFRVLDVSKQELAHTLRQYKGAAWEQSPILQAIHEQERVPGGGAPFGCLIGDYEFNHHAADVALLTDMARIAAAKHCPFISAAHPGLLQIDNWAELATPETVVSTFTTDEYAGWRRLRSHHSARYVSLTLPRVLARSPCHSRPEDVEGFAFEELVDAEGSADFCWSNSAYVMGAQVARSFQRPGQRAGRQPLDGGAQPMTRPRMRTEHVEHRLHCLTEVALPKGRERELSDAGLTPLVWHHDSDSACFAGAKTLYQPAPHEQPGADASSLPCIELPSIFATCRLAQQLKHVVRDRLASFQSLDTTQRWLSDWLMAHVDREGTPAGEPPATRHALAGGEVVVDEPPESPGHLRARFFLRPHDQPQGLTVSLQWSRDPAGARRTCH